MNSIISLIAILCFSISLLSQEKEQVLKLVNEGASLHDQRDYLGAIEKYERALEIDDESPIAYAELAMTYFTIKEYKKSYNSAKKAFKYAKDGQLDPMMFIVIGNSLDMLEESEEAIDYYNKGLELYPKDFMIYYNKGIAFNSLKKYDDALGCFERAVVYNPKHASSHYAISAIKELKKQRIPSILARSRFLALEPKTDRAKLILPYLTESIVGNVVKKSNNSMQLNLNSDLLNPSKENNFSTVDMLMTISVAANMLDTSITTTPNKVIDTNRNKIKKFIKSFESMCGLFKETKKDNKGFYWEYYVPYFIELKEKNHLETFVYLIFSSMNNIDVNEWLDKNKDKVENYYEWSSNFKWYTE